MDTKKFVYFVCILYALSLILPGIVYIPSDMEGPLFGFMILLNPLAMFSPAWWANPLMILALILTTRHKFGHAIVPAIVALFLALSSFGVDEIPRNEGGVNNLTVDHLGAGFWLWLITIIIVMGNIIYLNFKTTTNLLPANEAPKPQIPPQDTPSSLPQ